MRGRCPTCRRYPAWDLRGWIAVGGIVLTFGLAFVLVFTGNKEGATIPPWAASFLTLVVQGYYMTKGAERHAAALRRRDTESGDDTT